LKTVEAVCPFCGCLCDDIVLEVEGGEIKRAVNACPISQSKYLHHQAHRLKEPLVGGSPATLEEAVERAAEILKKARRPLIYGLSSTECKAISKAIEVAEETKGILDNTSSVCHGPTILALQQVGESKASLGEVKNRADLVVFWGANPSEAHVRHFVRYSVTPKGLYVSQGRRGRKVVVVDVRETRTTKMADRFVKVEPGRDFELLQALRALVRGEKLLMDSVSGVDLGVLEELAAELASAKFGVIFFGLGLTQTGGRHMNIDAAVGLVDELNKKTKFVLTPMRGHFNVAGANTVSTWQTGYPYGVDFSLGYPRYNPGEYTAVDVLARGEADAALIVASDPVATFPLDAAQHLAKIPVITLDQKETPTTRISEVAIPVAAVGIEAEGTAYRMDGIPLLLPKVLEPPRGVLSDAQVLELILGALRRGESN